MHIKLVSPQAAWLSIFFVGKSVMLHLLEGPELRTRYWEDRKEKKAQRRDLNPRLFYYEACALLLCYNRCPAKCKVVSTASMIVFTDVLNGLNLAFILPTWFLAQAGYLGIWTRVNEATRKLFCTLSTSRLVFTLKGWPRRGSSVSRASF